MSAERPGDETDELAGDAPVRRRRRGGGGSLLRELPVLVLVALAVSVLVKAFLVQAFYIPSQSMENTLRPDDRVLVSKLTMRTGGVKRGDVVVFRDPGQWLPPTQRDSSALRERLRDGLAWVGLAPSVSDRDLVKRVIGLPGDRVRCCDARGRLTVNGKSLDEPYVFAGDVPSQLEFDVRVPAKHLWVMGDHRSDSEDSRYHQDDPDGGFVPVDNVLGRVTAVVWPLSRFSVLHAPKTFTGVGLTGKAHD